MGAGCQDSEGVPNDPVGPEMMNLHVVGNHIEDASGEIVH